MSKPLTIDLFVEDRAHEAFLMALIGRLAGEEERAVHARVRTARGGHGRVLTELNLYQQSALKGLGGMTLPELLVVAIDANCKSYQQARREIRAQLLPPFSDLAAIACPAPHVEVWYLADPDSFHEVVGVRPSIKRAKCERDHYKRLLANAVTDGGHPPTLGGIEFANEIVAKMDFYRAGKRHRSLMRAVNEVRSLLCTGRGV